MNCKDASRLVQDYVDGRLFGLERKAFEDHLSVCPGCEEELKAFQEVFSCLDAMEQEAPPVWFEETVVRKLKLEGIIFEPKIPLLKKLAAAVGRVPNVVKYPVAVTISATVIYLPIRFVLAFAKGVAGKVAVLGSESLIAVDQTLEEISVLSRLFDIVARDLRAIRTILEAFFSLLTSAGGGIILSVLGVLALVTLMVVRHFRSPLRSAQRRSHNAPYCL